MLTCDKAQHCGVEERGDAGHEIWRFHTRRWVGATARLAGLGAVVSAAIISAAAPLSGPPSATADNRTSVTATVSGVADPATSVDYLKSLYGPFNNMQAAVQNMSKALKARDWDGVHGACQDLRGSGQQLKARLPSPDSRVTPEVQAAVDDINSASDACSGLGASSQQGDLSQFSSLIGDAQTHLTHARSLLTPHS